MKPIELKIKGLNSFNEEQTIDFERLTERGLFGIFGPTGSGKSTVLDGITLALYGEIARKSSNYININCNSLALSFKFQISGAHPKVYVVERSFKRDKKSGNPQSDKCRLKDITNGEELVLADKVKEVTNNCREIIGLSLEDFTRTVVLPQGKFSEFLKLEGKARRDMLERLFNLQCYGDELARKLGSRISNEKTQYSILLGELKGFEDISEDGLKIREEELEKVKNNLNIENKELERVEKNYNEAQELWNLTQELTGYQVQEAELKSKTKDIETYKLKVELGEGALKVFPYIQSYEGTLNNIQLAKDEKEKLKEVNENLKIKLEEIQKQWNIWREKKDNEVPQLRVKEEKIKNALQEQRNLNILKKEIKDLLDKITILEKQEQEVVKDIKTAEVRVQKGNKIISDTEIEAEGIKIDGSFKAKVQQGLLLSEKINDLKNFINVDKEKCSKAVERINISKADLSNLNENLRKTSYELEKVQELLKELLNNVPGKNEDLVSLQKLLMESKEKWSKYNIATENIKEANLSIVQIEGDLKYKIEEKSKIVDNISYLREKIEELNVENMAQSIRESLREGEACPVCGSKEHHLDYIKTVQYAQINELKEKLDSQDLRLKNLEMDITRGETTIKGFKDRIYEKNKEIEELGLEFKKLTVEELENRFNNLREAIDIFDSKKESLEKELSKLLEKKLVLEGKINTSTSIILQYEKQIEELNSNVEKNIHILENIQEEINNIKGEIKIEDFKAASEEIELKEKEREKLEGDLKRYRKALEDIVALKEVANKNLNEIRERLVKEKSILVEKKRIKDEREDSIRDKVGDDSSDLEGMLNKVVTSMLVIEEEFISYDKEKNSLDEEFKKCNEAFIEMIGKVSNLEKRLIEEEVDLNKAVKEEGFDTVQDVMKNLISKEQIKYLRESIEKYNNAIAKVMGAVESILKKIGDRSITEEYWDKVKEEKAVKEIRVKEINEYRIRIEEEVNLISKKIEQLNELIERRSKIERKLSLLSDLEKLFKGKKFVEFVATERLKYVSMEASKRLKEISSGNYGLEVDENGKFIIRDYKNGGAARDASTLSGGETFLTSLALALALSAEIQLKGTAPLELFFLDEGFGTLDDNLLEVVISSLERIHNDRLKVGIISHVESIKNRVPVKLMITPSEPGNGGSKIKIELS